MNAKTKNIITWLLAGLLALAFLGSGISKIMGVEMQIKNFESWGFPLWMRFPVGISEVVFAIGLLLSNYRKWIIYAIFGWAVVAIYTHIQATPPQYNMVGGPIVFVLINTVLYFLTKDNNND